MAQAMNQKDFQQFIGMISLYNDLYPHHAATLAGKNKKFIWTAVQEEAFL